MTGEHILIKLLMSGLFSIMFSLVMIAVWTFRV